MDRKMFLLFVALTIGLNLDNNNTLNSIIPYE